MKKNVFLLLLAINAVIGLYAEDDTTWLKGILNNALDKAVTGAVETGRSSASTSPEFPSLNIINNTGFTVKNAFISQAGVNNWGRNVLKTNLYYKQSVLIFLQAPLSEVNRYNIRLQDEDGASYSKRNVVIGMSTSVEFVIEDVD